MSSQSDSGSNIWILCPTQPTTRIPAPPSSDLFLGAVVKSRQPDDLRVPLNRTEPPNVPSGWIKETEPETTRHRVKESSSNSIGFRASIAQIIGFGPHFDASWGKGSDILYEFEEERNVVLNVPGEDRSTEVDGPRDTALAPRSLCEDAVTASQNVQSYLNKTSLRKPVYIVTGIKHVKGIRMSRSSQKDRGFGGGVDVDATAAGVPLTVGLDGTHASRREVFHSVDGGAPFVFCVSLTKMEWDRSGTMATSDVRKGTYMDADGSKNQQPEIPVVLFTKDAVARDFVDSATVELVDEQSVVRNSFLFPKDFDDDEDEEE